MDTISVLSLGNFDVFRISSRLDEWVVKSKMDSKYSWSCYSKNVYSCEERTNVYRQSFDRSFNDN